MTVAKKAPKPKPLPGTTGKSKPMNMPKSATPPAKPMQGPNVKGK